MHEYYSVRLVAISASLNCLRANPAAKCFYEIMSNALIWSDEIPAENDQNPEAYWVLRCLFRYRTSLIMADLDVELESFWRLGIKLFPDWPGFKPERRAASLAEVFIRLRDS